LKGVWGETFFRKFPPEKSLLNNMASINYETKEINSRIVYCGPGLCGKTTNLRFIQQKAVPAGAVTIAGDSERTLFFDYLPVELGEINGFKTKFHLYTLPGRVFYDASRSLILKDVDGVVFVADSRFDKVGENLECLELMRTNLREQRKNLSRIPHVIQYNKRDRPNAVSAGELKNVLNPEGVEDFEAVASSGAGVFPTFKAIVRLVLTGLKAKAKNA